MEDIPDNIKALLAQQSADTLAALTAIADKLYQQLAYSTPNLPLIPEQACHPFQTKAATDSRAKLPPWQIV